MCPHGGTETETSLSLLFHMFSDQLAESSQTVVQITRQNSGRRDDANRFRIELQWYCAVVLTLDPKIPVKGGASAIFKEGALQSEETRNKT